MGANYSLPGRIKINELLSRLRVILDEFIGNQPRPLQFINEFYTEIDSTGFMYNIPIPDRYPILNYGDNEFKELFNKIEIDFPAITKLIKNVFLSDLVKRDEDCGEELYTRCKSFQFELNNIVFTGKYVIYKEWLFDQIEVFINEFLDIRADNYQSSDLDSYASFTHNRSQYCLTEAQIKSLYNFCTEKKIINTISFDDFDKCFDLANRPEMKPTFIRGQKNLFIYILSLINKIDENFALINFGIEKFYTYKGRPIPNSKKSIKNKIDLIIPKSPIIVTSM